jgi:sigma-B regulation protein RsbU (phosphoserine phosphatase)
MEALAMPRPPSIRLLVTTLVVAPLLLLAAALVWLSSATSHRIAEDLGQSMVRAAIVELEANARRFLGSAVRVGELYARRVEAGTLPADQLSDWVRPILDDLLATPDVASICIGTPDGRAVYIQRAHGRLEMGIGAGPGDGQCWEGVIDPDGTISPEPLRIYKYDPTSRPWYQAGLASGQPTWAPIYTWFGETGNDAETSTAYVRPVHHSDGSLLGILVVDVTLGGLGQFLKSLPIAEHGHLFVVDHQGLAVASSDGSVNSKTGERLPLVLIESPAARAVAASIVPLAQAGDASLAAGGGRVPLPDGPARVTVAPFTPHSGVDWGIIAVVPESAFMGDAAAAQNRSLLVAGLIALGGLVLAIATARGLARPLVSIADHVKRIGAGDFASRLDLRAARELVEVSSELNRMSEGLKQRMDLEKSLEVAMEVQQSLLPMGPPTAAGLDVAGSSRYCDATGGDYFDFIDVAPMPGGKTMIAVGDVMGHGIGAALLMATARAALRAHASLDADLGALLTRVNAILARDARHGKFMTMLLLIADPSQGSFRWASAGHDPPIILDPVRGWVETDGGDLPLGVMEDVTYQESAVSGLNAGAIIVIGTDGIWEAKNPRDEDFTKDRLRAVVAANSSAPAAAIVAAVDQAMSTFLEGRAIQDDVTMVILRILPQQPPAT